MIRRCFFNSGMNVVNSYGNASERFAVQAYEIQPIIVILSWFGPRLMNKDNMVLVIIILLFLCIFGLLVVGRANTELDRHQLANRRNAFMVECIEDQTVAKCEVLWGVQ